MYLDSEQGYLDIDWFFTDNQEIGCVASCGGKLPVSIANLNDEESENLWSYICNLPETTEYVINPLLLDILEKRGSKITDNYLKDFIFYSKRGIYSFDKTIFCDFLDLRYHLVAKPQRPLLLNELPIDIRCIIAKSPYCSTIRNTVSLFTNQIK